MISLKKKIFTSVGIVAVTAGVAFNLNNMRTNDADVQITLANAEALARESDSGGNFPACQKKKGTGETKTIPFCNSENKCKSTEEKAGRLDVNNCTQDPT